ncbi:uncharacterized protein LOC135371436 isoform X1 [Ornithodoros turicata]|uniref:uncharacterized protein LOC135371436 isoform X1 n=1 Tax=Ornithodoros turicata TaxID=34597 RepID=UPI00313A2C81
MYVTRSACEFSLKNKPPVGFKMNEEDESCVEVKISLTTILQHVGEGVRCLKEGEEVINAGHIIECSVVEVTPSTVQVLGFVLQSSAPTKDPHKVSLALTEGGNIQLLSCTCPAGESHKCKHCIAVLLHINRAQRLTKLSSTDKPQAWGRLAKAVVQEKYAPKNVVHLPFCPKYEVPRLPRPRSGVPERLVAKLPYVSQTEMYLRKRRTGGNFEDKDSTEHPSKQPAPSLPPTMSELLSATEHTQFCSFLEDISIIYDENAISRIERVTREQSFCSSWKEYRRGMATSSNLHAFLTKARKLTKEPRPHNLGSIVSNALRYTTYQSPCMKNGIEKEADARRRYIEVLQSQGHIVEVSQSGFMISQQCPVMGCSPDGIVNFHCRCCEGVQKVLEIKCPQKIENSFTNLKPKPSYFTQIQVIMGIFGINACDFFGYWLLCHLTVRILWNVSTLSVLSMRGICFAL